MPKVAIFASGKGSNADQIIRFLKKRRSSVEVVLILTNKINVGIYDVADEFQIPIRYFSNREFESEAKKVVSFLKENKVDWIVLAGFLRKVELSILNAYEDKIINLHPSLLPNYGGRGMYGKFVHEAVINAKEKESGITIHLVNGEFDKGEILFQAKCSIEKGQTVEELTEKIQILEHRFLPEIIEKTILERS